MKKSKLLYLLNVIIAIIVSIITFTLLPKEIELGGQTKPSFILILLSLLPFLTTLLCMEVTHYDWLGYVLFIAINFIIIKIILSTFGIIIPSALVGGFCLTFSSLLVGLYLQKIKARTKFSINLAWIQSEEGYLKLQKKGAKVFFIYSFLQALALVLHLFNLLSLNLAFIIPLVSFAILIILMLKSAKSLS